MSTTLQNRAKKGAELITQQAPNTRFRVISHYDADGITAAAIICLSLRREGYDFHVTLMRNPFTEGLEKVKKENNEFIIFTDMGSGQLPILETFSSQILIIDHHQIIKEKTADHILQINANLFDINGNYDASGASMAYAVAKELNNKNRDLSSFALAGATGDKQYIGGFSGYNNTIINDALTNDIVQEKQAIKLSGETLLDSLFYSIEPFYAGLSGNKKGIETFLSTLSIGPNQSYHDLTEKQQETLQSALLLILLEKGCESNILETVIRPRYYSVQTHGEMEQFADLLDSCGKGGNRDVGLALCLGDTQAYQKARSEEKAYKEQILEELFIIENKGVEEKQSYRYFYSKNSSQGGVVGGIATNFLLDNKKPLLSIVKKPDELHISCRGNQQLVKKGLDLGSAMEQISKQLNGNGGGHKIAAGATLPRESLETFLTKTDEILSKQLKISGDS